MGGLVKACLEGRDATQQALKSSGGAESAGTWNICKGGNIMLACCSLMHSVSAGSSSALEGICHDFCRV